MDDGWLTIAEVAELYEKSGKWVREEVKNQTFDLTREVTSPGRGGKAVQIHWTSLGERAKRQYQALQQAPAAPAEVLNPLEHPAWAMEEMQRRLDVLRRWDIRSAETPRKRRTLVRKHFAEELGLSHSTLYKWERAYAQEGEAGLMPKYARERKEQRVLTQEIKGTIRNWYNTQHKRSAKIIHEMLEDYCRQCGLKLPSYSSVAHYVGGLSESVRSYGRGTAAAWRANFEPVARRDWQSLLVNEIWCGDHRQIDILCKQKITTRTKSGVRSYWKVAAPWLTVWLDLRSWCYTGWHLAWAPNSYTIALALRDGIIGYGVPRIVYVDCGKDYRSAYLSHKQIREQRIGKIPLNADMAAFAAGNNIDVNPDGLLDALDIDKRHAQPVNLQEGFKGGVPRAKPVESSFNWFRAMEHEFPGWRGERPDQMPEATRKMLAKRIDENTPLPTFDDVLQAVSDSIAEHNSRSHGEREKAANEYFDEPYIVRLPESQHRALDVLLWPGKPVKVTNSAVWHKGSEYQAPELASWGGEKLIVREDPRNIERVVVMTPGRPSQFVCVAENMSFRKVSYHPTREDYKENVAKPKAEARRTMEALQDAYETLHADDAELLERGKAQRTSPDDDDTPPTPPKPRGGKPRGGKPKPAPQAPPKSGLQAGGKGNKVYVLSERTASTVKESTAEYATTKERINKVIPKAYHDAASGVERADRKAETREILEDTSSVQPAFKFVDGRWIAINGAATQTG